MSSGLPPDLPAGRPPPTASDEAPELSNALAADEEQRRGETAAEAEYRHNVRPPDWINPTPRTRYNLVVIGAGPAGIAAARLAAQMGAAVALVERDALGGDSLNVGCIPTKTLIATARHIHQIRQGAIFGVTDQPAPDACFARMMERVRQVQATISRQDSAYELARLGIDVFFGAATFVSAEAVAVGDRALNFRRALIATGGRQRALKIEGCEEAGYRSVRQLLDLKALPPRLMVIGGGPLGTEIAQAYCRLGSEVTLVQRPPKFLPEEERDAAQLMSESLARDGVQIRLNTTAIAMRREGGERVVTLESNGQRYPIAVDEVLAGVGRRPSVSGLGVEAAGVARSPEGGVAVDDFLRTSNRRVFAAGDACMARRFTQVAEASARLATLNALTWPTRRISDAVLPWCTHTDPEVAHVGLHVADASDRNMPLKTYTVLMHQVDRAVTDGERIGFAKIHTRLGTDQILGATIVARDAGDIINEITLAMQGGIGLRALAEVVTAFPSRSQTLQLAAEACIADLVPAGTRQRMARRLQRDID